MRTPLVLLLTLQITCADVCAEDYYQFARISQPQEEAELENGSQIAGAGYVFMPEAEKKEDFEVRVRLYRPIEGDFEVVREAIAVLGAGFRDEPSTWQYKFSLNLEKPVPKGEYLLWVDCFDKSARRQGLLASASQFVTVAKTVTDRPVPPAGPDRPGEARGPNGNRLIRILNPAEGERYSSRANIAGIGFVFLPHVDRMDDVAVRARLYRPTNQRMELIQEVQVPVKAGLVGQPATYQYAYDLLRKVPMKEGKHLLQVECLDVSEEIPQVLVSARRFVPVVELQK
jgi:hypothetical protein